jgi:hypothetical protein
MPGPAPKQQHQRERDTRRRQSDSVTVTRDGVLRGPSIEEATFQDTWSPATRAWWDDWRKSPQAALFETTDWRRLALLALTVENYLRRPAAALLSEIRLNEERLGALYLDRLRGKVRIEDDGTPTLAAVADLPTARDRIADRMRASTDEDDE